MYNDSFSFAFVRNPYDRLVSAYHFIKERKVDHRKNRHIFRFITECGDFPTFCMRLKNINHVVLDPQYKFICDGEKIIVDFIGKYENLHEDWKSLLDKLKVPYMPLPTARKSSHKDYMSYYTEEAKQAVGEFYKKDFEILGY